ncbi:Oxysterol-binding protein- protein 10 [Chamberlinius hualienensis]
MMGATDEGQLYKYTNVMKGWQYRWFILIKDTGILEYYMSEEDTKRQRPRGSIYLGGAVISPSEEDSCTFNVCPSTGEGYRLRADGAKERQLWIHRLRTVAEKHSNYNTVALNEKKLQSQNSSDPNTNVNNDNISANSSSTITRPKKSKQRFICNPRSLYDTFSAAQDILKQVEQNHFALSRVIEDLPSNGPDVRSIDTDLLLMKATSQATLLCLKQCHWMLQKQQQAVSFQLTGVTGGATMEIIDPFSSTVAWNNSVSLTDVHLASTEESSATNFPENELQTLQTYDEVELNSDQEKTDDEDQIEVELGASDEHRALILQLLPQMKLGMDVTQVALPTFLLEPYSLLEMYANFFGHPDIFLRIPEMKNAEDRISAVVEWYLTAFHVGRKLDEDYVITFPSAFARSILNVPWFELGGKVGISCIKTGCSASVTFHTKPFYGGKANKVTAEVKNNISSTVCKIQGEWNGILEFNYNYGEMKMIDTNDLKVFRKYVRPLSLQSKLESRILWSDVSESIKNGNLKFATDTKRNIEERQRKQIRQWQDSGYQFHPKFFISTNGGGWDTNLLLLQESSEVQTTIPTTTTIAVTRIRTTVTEATTSSILTTESVITTETSPMTSTTISQPPPPSGSQLFPVLTMSIEDFDSNNYIVFGPCDDSSFVVSIVNHNSSSIVYEINGNLAFPEYTGKTDVWSAFEILSENGNFSGGNLVGIGLNISRLEGPVRMASRIATDVLFSYSNGSVSCFATAEIGCSTCSGKTSSNCTKISRTMKSFYDSFFKNCDGMAGQDFETLRFIDRNYVFGLPGQ